MIEKEVLIQSDKGLRSKNVSYLVKKAMSFKSSISIIYDGKKADAKSLINVMALRVPQKAKIIISLSGEDEVLAEKEMIAFINNLR